METQWTTQYKNDLPDECFAYIEPGGEKDEDGKTVPRDLRHFPYKNHLGELSKEHINNGLGQLNKDLGDWATDSAKAEIKKALCAAVKRWNRENSEDKIGSDVCGIHPEESGRPKLKTEQMADYEEPSVDDLLDWLSQDISRIWDELWSLREEEDMKFDAVNKRIDDAILLITGLNVEALKEQAVTLADLKAQIDSLAARVAALEQGEKAEQDDEREDDEEEEQQAGPRSDADRAKAHFNISDDDWDKLTDEEKQAYINQLPPRGQGGEDDESDEEEDGEDSEETAEEVCRTCARYVDGKCTVSGQLKAEDDECDTGEYEARPEEPGDDVEDDLEESRRSITEMKARIKDLESKLSLAEARAQTWMNVAERRHRMMERRR